MDENILHDLLRKIANTVRDFSLEHDIPGLVDVSVDANRIIVEVKERALGGPVIGGLPYDISAGTEMYVPAPAGTFAPNESIYPIDSEMGTTESVALSIHATYDPIHYNDVEENARKQPRDVPDSYADGPHDDGLSLKRKPKG